MCCRSIDSFCMKTIRDKMHDILIRSPSAVHGHSSGTGGCVTKLLNFLWDFVIFSRRLLVYENEESVSSPL